ncbi:MAG TPA: sugar transferase [Pyrinomonadaceae bacterium]|nr:sugar transferase [Pyrinomonadaceae bacterium]
MRTETAIRNDLAILKAENRVPRFVMPLVKTVVVVMDAALTILCFLAAFKIREGSDVFSATAWAWSPAFVPYAGIVYFAVPIRLLMLAYERAYQFQGAFSYTREAIKIFKAVSVGSLLITGWAFLFRGGYAFRDFSYSRGVFFIDFALALALFFISHLFLRSAQARIRGRGINLIPTLVVGTNAEAAQTVRELNDRRDLGYRVIGVVRTDSAETGEYTNLDADVIGTFDDLAPLIRDLEIQEVIITDDTISSDRLFEAMMQVGRKQRVEFRFAPTLFNLLPQKTSVEQIGVLPMVRLFREPLSDLQRFIKRASDIVISGFAVVILTPLLLLVSLMVKRSSRGPVMFRQERVGMDGRIFLCYKFRTMYADADDAAHREAYRKNIRGDEEANAGDTDQPVFGKVKNDDRVTPAGRWLRRSSLDELPQLFNVLKGDMSIVGPRPPIPYEVEGYELWHRKRLDMKPGITGLWQVSGRNRLTFDEMVRTDLYYIENWSLWLDLKIILLTLPAVWRGDGAR